MTGSLYTESIRRRMLARLAALYGADRAGSLLDQLLARLGQPQATARSPLPLSERDVILIAYGDHAQRTGEAPLATLRDVLLQTAHPAVNSLHLLPFYPYSSDDGFSVIDYDAVDPALGSWDDIRALNPHFRLMFDAVFNHISRRSAWFQGFLRGEAPYTDYFIVVDPATDLSLVTRPRTLPLLTPFETTRGAQHVWTTFSDDQIDLNYANPDVLLAMMDVLLFYVGQGADLIRLDAIAFLWKRIGTTCIHLPETHLVIQLMRDALDWAAPHVLLVTETNVPHAENISYFGDGGDEAQMVYQFPLPPLALHTLRSGDATALTNWAASIERVSERTTFFNFTASHDGIGVRPVEGILTDAEIAALVRLAEAHGGYVSYRRNSDGTQSPYELNVTYFDAVTHPDIAAAQPEVAVSRFMVSQAIMLAFVGVPGIYFSSLFGSRNFREGVAQTRRYRTINRQKFDADDLLRELKTPETIRARVYHRYMELLRARANEPAFHPLGTQTVLDGGSAVFALERVSPDGLHRVLALHNVTDKPAAVPLPSAHARRDLLTGQAHTGGSLTLSPYQICWLKEERAEC